MSNPTPFYEKFVKKPSQPRNAGGTSSKQHNVDAAHQKHAEKAEHSKKKAAAPLHIRQHNGKYPSIIYDICDAGTPVFSSLTAEAKNILEHFPEILAQVLPLDAQKKQQLPQHIHELFHELTDERGSRKTQYLNNPVKLSAYAHYYVWWNLVRLVKLLKNIELPLENGDFAADFGSGPLTLVCALWIAKPELRRKALTWYCVDISHRALSFGEELFLALCAYTGKTAGAAESPWRIKKVCGAFGTVLTEKVALVTEANMFNEVFWNSPLGLDTQAEKTLQLIMQYVQPQGAVLLIEPGIPLAGTFLSLMRDGFLQEGFAVKSPCPHSNICCLPNRNISGRAAKMLVAAHKWCHFTFETADSPKNLLRLSEASGLGKTRASLSFLFCSADRDTAALNTRHEVAQFGGKNTRDASLGTPMILVRICSDIIMPEPQTLGRYACSEKGFMLLTSPAYKDSVLNTAVSGSMLLVPEAAVQLHRRDKKTNALLVSV